MEMLWSFMAWHQLDIQMVSRALVGRAYGNSNAFSGHYYLKFDYYSASQKWLQTPKEISEWIRSGADKNQEFGKRTAELAQKFIAGWFLELLL